MPRVKGLDRAAITTAAADLTDQTGDIQAVTLAQIAAHFGIRIPSLYDHVANLEQVRLDVSVLALRELASALQSACAGRSGDEALRQMLKAYRQYARAHPGRYSATHLYADDRPDWAAAGQALLALFGQLLEPLALGKTERIHAIRGLRSLAHGFVALEAAHGFRMPVSPEASFEHLIATYLAGLQARAGRV